MIPYYDTPRGRFALALRGVAVALVGLLLWVFDLRALFSTPPILVGIAVVLWAWLHKTHSGSPEGYTPQPQPPSPRNDREAELRKMLNDPERRHELDRLFLEVTRKGAIPIGVSKIKTILNYEFGDTDNGRQRHAPN